MKKLLTVAALVAMLVTPLGAETIAGGEATDCIDANAFYHPILPDGSVATYWNNVTCIMPDAKQTDDIVVIVPVSQ